MKFFEYSESKHYTIRPDIFEYDRLERPAVDLILGVKTMKKLGISTPSAASSEKPEGLVMFGTHSLMKLETTWITKRYNFRLILI
jgi:hypothetical protein